MLTRTPLLEACPPIDVLAGQHGSPTDTPDFYTFVDPRVAGRFHKTAKNCGHDVVHVRSVKTGKLTSSVMRRRQVPSLVEPEDYA